MADGRGELHVGTLTTVEELAALGPDWDALVGAMPRPSPFLLRAWLLPWARHYGHDHALEFHVAHRDGRLVGALPLCIERHLGLRRLRFPGGPQAVLGDMLLSDGEGTDTGRALIDQISRRGGHDVLDVYGIPGGGLLEQNANANELRVIERVEAPVIDSQGSWEDTYKANASGKRRYEHRRRRRRLAEQGELQTRVVSTPDEIDAVLEDVFRLHHARWDGRPDGSEFASPRGAPFQREALLTLAAEGIPRIALTEFDGRPLAFNIYFLFARRMYVYRQAFDPALSASAPGIINMVDALEAGFEEGVDRVEFLGGAEQFKRDLANRFEPLYVGLGLPGTLRGRAAAAASAGMIATRRRLKRSERLRRFYFDSLAPVRRRLGDARGR